MTTQRKFTVTAARGMLPLLATELKQLGISQTKQEQGNIRFTGTLEDAYRICLWSRIAIRVLLPIAHFKAENPDELYAGIKNLSWEEHIEPEDSTLAVDFNSFRSRIKHSQYGAQRVKDGIVDRFREQSGMRPSVDLHQPDLRVNVYLKHNQAIVSIDLSGESLHKRGYRVKNTDAPLKEHLAAAILYSAEWPRLARQGWGLLDPMCGSGTFLIEAAMMAADIAPSIHRDYFGFSYWKQHDKTLWKTLKADAERRRQAGLSKLGTLVGGDISEQAVAASKENITEAGLEEYIKVEHRQLIDWPSHKDELPVSGLIVCNPPYGERIGDSDLLPDLYEAFGNVISQAFNGWRSALITDNPNLGKLTGLTLFESKPFDNGPIACEALFYRAPKPVKMSETAPHNTVESHRDPWESTAPKSDFEPSEQGQMFANRLTKNFKHLAKWAKKNEVSCYRVYDADLPDYALAIDLYDDQVHVQEYAPPKQIDPEKAISRLQEAMQIIPEVLNISAKNVVLKVRQKQRGHNQYEVQAMQNHRFEVIENGLKFWINLKDYLDTGLFLDHRDVRHWILKNARNMHFLNLFCYTGSATVYAAAGGAKSTTSVDMSNTYLNWAKDNLALNQLESDAHSFVRENCLTWIEQALEKRLQFDLIFLDPPTFSNSSKMEGVLDVQRDHVDMISKLAQLLTDKGKLIFSTNNRHFKLEHEQMPALEFKDMTKQTMPVDFQRNQKIHYCWLVSKRSH